jgi:hypothetical protein
MISLLPGSKRGNKKRRNAYYFREYNAGHCVYPPGQFQRVVGAGSMVKRQIREG